MKNIAIIIFFILIIVSCGKNSTAQNNADSSLGPVVATSDPVDDSPDPTPTPPNISGTWEGCEVIGADSYFAQVIITATTITSTIDTYSGSTICGGVSSFTSVKSGTIDVTTTTSNIPSYSGGNIDANHVDITISSFTMTPNNAGVAFVFNSTTVCGAADWISTTTKNTLNLSNCDPAAGVAHPDEITSGVVENIIYLDTASSPNKLYINSFVSSNGASTTRPTSLSSADPFSMELELQ